MKKYYNLIYIVLTTLAIVGAITSNALEIFTLHVISASIALGAAIAHTALTAKRTAGLALELSMKLALLCTFVLGIVISNRLNPILDALHLAFALAFILLFIIRYTAKYLLGRN